jgi:hypothetical protein
VIEFVLDVEEPLRESAKLAASLIFQLGWSRWRARWVPTIA